MKKWKKMLWGFLVVGLAVCVSGCSFGKKSSKDVQAEMSEDSVVMMVGSHEVRYSEVMVYSYFLKCQYNERFGKEVWQYKINADETIGDQAKQEIVNMITQLKIISDVADEQGISLTADEQDEALQQAENLLHDASQEDREQYMLTVRGVNAVYQENALADKMFYVATNDADANVSDEEAQQKVLKDQEASDQESSQAARSEETNVTQEQINQAKEQIIAERQTDMFVEKYNAWLQDKDVDINQDFWNNFSLI